MAISEVAVDGVVKASTMNALVRKYNRTPGQVLLTASGIWTVPPGIERFRVILSGGGGGAGLGFFDPMNDISIPGNEGGDARVMSGIFDGYAAGTVINFTIGAGAAVVNTAGQSTSFEGMISGGGAAGPTANFNNGGVKGSPGSATWPSGMPQVYFGTRTFIHGYSNGHPMGYGQGAPVGGAGGRPGFVFIEW